ncbi:MAG: hypothetical protein IPJ19_17570 [Planctomycetes bacterium]|nr:hypothetical protein [Planctomycetota bacterium]
MARSRSGPGRECSWPSTDSTRTDQGLEELEQRASVLREVEQAIARLPVLFRMPLVLKEIAGLPLADISAVLGVRVETVKTRLHRARLAVRKEVESAPAAQGAAAGLRQAGLSGPARRRRSARPRRRLRCPRASCASAAPAVFAIELAQDAAARSAAANCPPRCGAILSTCAARAARKPAPARRPEQVCRAGTGPRRGLQAGEKEPDHEPAHLDPARPARPARALRLPFHGAARARAPAGREREARALLLRCDRAPAHLRRHLPREPALADDFHDQERRREDGDQPARRARTRISTRRS